jgi:glycosyltransferase involved in cell wall biosynthesis
MRILVVIQRYGEEIAGGAEAACRGLAEHMVQRGHDVHVLTSCALSYDDWADHFSEGVSELNGVTVHRRRVREPRSGHEFGPLMQRALGGASYAVQRDWLRVFGPEIEISMWLEEHASEFDVADVFTYLYAPASVGCRWVRSRLPTVVHPTAHDEAMFWVPAYDELFASTDVAICLTPEEAHLVERRTHGGVHTEVLGLGLDVDVHGDGGAFRARFGLGPEPYVLYVGRVDPGKGAHELYGYMTQLQSSGRTDATLVILGEPQGSMPLDPHPGVVFTGFVDDQTKHDAIAGCAVLVQPSYFESFSLSLCEAWLHAKPAMVQDQCAVLFGQAVRSGGALRYRGLSQFDACLQRLLDDADLREAIGAAGREYVAHEYGWSRILDDYERILRDTIGRRRVEASQLDPHGFGAMPLRWTPR